MENITPDNFIQVIQQMTVTERRHLKLPDILNLIMAAPHQTNVVSLGKFNELLAVVENIKTQGINNSTEINQLKLINDETTKENEKLIKEREDLLTRLNNLEEKLSNQGSHLNEIEQYLRSNNVEIVGYPEMESDDPNVCKTAMQQIINTLPEIRDDSVTKEQIDISHALKSERKDRKNVGVIRFVHRKTKIRILEAKRKAGNEFKFQGQSIYINDHLSPFNRGLFAKATEIKRNQGYKYLWVKHGFIFMRKTDRSELIRISSYDDFPDSTNTTGENAVNNNG